MDIQTASDEWGFDYSIEVTGGAASVTLIDYNGDEIIPAVQGSAPMVTAYDNTYIYFRFKIENVPGNELTVTFSISNVKDTENNINETDTSDNIVVHTISSMPTIGPFEN